MDDNIVRTFYSDASHNYMVIECPHELRDNYQYKMLAANQIRGLLLCSSRCIDNQEYLYYDITSRQSMEDVYDRKPVRGADMEKLLGDLLRVEKTLTEYLLDASHMILDPSCIYMDFRGNECSFVYYPGEVGDTGWEELFSFLADRVDGRDKRAAALVYRLCMMAEKPGFRLREETLEELGIHIGKKMKENGSGALFDPADIRGRAGYTQEAFPGPGSERFKGFDRDNSGGQSCAGGYSTDCARDSGRMTAVEGESGSSLYGSERYGFERHEFERGGKRGTGKSAGFTTGREYAENEAEAADGISGSREDPFFSRMPVRVIFSLLMAAAGTGLIFLHRFVILGETERIMTFAAGGFLIAAGILLLIISLIRKRREKKEEDYGTGKDPVYRNPDRASETQGTGIEELLYGGGQEAEIWSPGTSGGLRSFYDPRGYSDMSGYSGDERTSAFRDYEKSHAVPSAGAEPSGYSGRTGRQEGEGKGQYARALPGETCVLGPETGRPVALYGTGTCRGEQISLADLPCVVGKMHDFVDQVLDDSSVSRMHARFSVDHEGKMTVRDLNSTNGTWLNGERLMPNESRVIRQGDHVRLGSMEFVYR